MATFLALLRGINVGGRNKIPMQDLRELCGQLGWRDVKTYIQSGNVLFRTEGGAGVDAQRRVDAPPSVDAHRSDDGKRSNEELEAELEAALERSFGLSIPVLVRSLPQWREYLHGNPFPEESEREPNRVMLALAKGGPDEEAANEIRKRAGVGERIERVGDALWIHFPEGAGRSKLGPALLDRAAGSPVTTRNWRTTQKLARMADELAATE